MTEQERIEKEAEQNADSFERRGCSAHYGYRVGYIAGANAELKRIDSDAAKIKHVITQLENKLLGKDSEIANHIAINSLLIDSDGEADLANKLYNLRDEMHKKEVAFELITKQMHNEIVELRKRLSKWEEE